MGVRIFSTDANLLDDVIVEVKKFVPTCNVYPSGNDIQNNKSQLLIDKLNDKDRQIGIWLLRWLGQLGWEVFEHDDVNNMFLLRKHDYSG
jgi:hypothetical protein